MAREIKLVQGDINITNGKIQTLQNEDKLKQQTLKIITTTKGGKYNPNYGSLIYNLIGRYTTDLSVLLPLIRNTIEEALFLYQTIQVGQETFQIMSDDEVLIRMENINVDPLDKTGFFVTANLKNRRGINTSISV